MNRESIDSSMMLSIGYDPGTSILEIEFKGGEIWQYFDFPETIWYEFESSDSKGGFFHREIKKQYAESRIG